MLQTALSQSFGHFIWPLKNPQGQAGLEHTLSVHLPSVFRAETRVDPWKGWLLGMSGAGERDLKKLKILPVNSEPPGLPVECSEHLQWDAKTCVFYVTTYLLSF